MSSPPEIPADLAELSRVLGWLHVLAENVERDYSPPGLRPAILATIAYIIGELAAGAHRGFTVTVEREALN